LQRFSGPRENRMNIHKNARLTPIGREQMVRAMLSGQTPQAAARAAGVCRRTAHKWLARFTTEGEAGLVDRSSRPKTLRRPTSRAIVDQVIALRRQRLVLCFWRVRRDDERPPAGGHPPVVGGDGSENGWP